MSLRRAVDHASSRAFGQPVSAAAAGAACIATSATLVRLADVSPATAAFFRCLYALPLLGLLALFETRRHGARPLRSRAVSWTAGVFFAADLVLWHHAIAAVGAGLATVLGNLQVVIVGLLAWWLFGERPSSRLLAAVPLVLAGVVLLSGALGSRAYGEDPLLGVVFGLCTSGVYAAYLLVLRQGQRDPAGKVPPRSAGPLFDATLVAAVVAAAVGPISGGVDLAPSWPAHGWLAALALTSQVLGWLLISVSLPRLPAAVTSLMLLLQPLIALMLGAAVLGERPSETQLLGCVVVLAAVVAGTSRSAPARTGSAAATTAEPTAQEATTRGGATRGGATREGAAPTQVS